MPSDVDGELNRRKVALMSVFAGAMLYLVYGLTIGSVADWMFGGGIVVGLAAFRAIDYAFPEANHV